MILIIINSCMERVEHLLTKLKSTCHESFRLFITTKPIETFPGEFYETYKKKIV